MYQVIIVFHVLFGLGIIGLVLMQQGKGADAGAAFGAGASGSVFGAQGAASFLSRTTAIFATLFFTTSLGLAVYNSQKGVAYDLMSDKASQQDALALPDVDGAKKPETAAVAPAPIAQPEQKPAASAPSTQEQSSLPVDKAATPDGQSTEAAASKAGDGKAAVKSEKSAPAEAKKEAGKK